MAKLEYEYPIKTVRGKLKDKFGANKRKAANAKGQQDPFSVIYGTRTSDPSADEITNRTRFGAIGKLVGQRRKDPSKRATDQAAFKAQSTYPTLTKYLWSVCTAQYNSSQS